MDGAEINAVSMQTYVESLDRKTLPRILQVCSGVYFQGSVYEVSGSEVCLSTGDMLKIIGTKLLSATTEDITTKETSELPLHYNGLFKMVLEDMPYSSVEEMVELLPVDQESFRPISFITRHRLEVKGCVVEAGQVLTLMEPRALVDGKPSVHCQLEGHQGPSSEILIPLSCRGKFYEHDNGQTYTLEQILTSPRLRTRYFRHIKTTKNWGPLQITPIYQVQAIMSMRKDVVTFPSSLEVDVVDVTAQSQSIKFVTPLSLEEVMAKPLQTFPAVAEVLEGPKVPSPFKSPWVEHLQKGQHLVLHSYCDSPMVLASTPKSKKAQQHYLVSLSYGGRLRRRPREFTAVYELCGALQQAPGLTVTTSRHCEALEEGLDSLSAGDQLDVLRNQMVELQGSDGERQTVEVLVCRRLSEADGEDDDDEDDDEDEKKDELLLPMYLEGHFVERIKDKKKYSLANLVKQFPLPLDVKVATKDTAVHCDPLSDHPALQLKETVVEPVVLASLTSKPDECFELPSRWLSLALYLTGDPLPWREGQVPEIQRKTVTELTEAFYHKFLSQVGSTDVLPPPLPPKRVTESQTSRHRSESFPTQLTHLTLSDENKLRKSPPPPPMILEDSPPVLERKPISPASSTQPNMYVQTPKRPSKKNRTASDSDHDYESPNEFMKNAAENVMFY